MIIKFRTKNGAWVFCDGIDIISKEEISYSGQHPNGGEWEEVFINTDFDGKSPIGSTLILGKKRGFRAVYIVTDEIAYLCNDSGKTIDRLN